MYFFVAYCMIRTDSIKRRRKSYAGSQQADKSFAASGYGLICTGCALLFRQSTAYPSKVEGGTVRLFASEDTEKPEADNGSSKTDVSESEEKVSPAATPTATPVPFEVSPEAEKGVWTSSGSNWMFMVDGQAYTGWLTDTDGKRYFF